MELMIPVVIASFAAGLFVRGVIDTAAARRNGQIQRLYQAYRCQECRREEKQK